MTALIPFPVPKKGDKIKCTIKTAIIIEESY